MNIFFYCKWINKDEWLTKIKKKFKNHKILTLSDKPNFEKIECAIIWEIPDKLLGKMKNLDWFIPHFPEWSTKLLMRMEITMKKQNWGMILFCSTNWGMNGGGILSPLMILQICGYMRDFVHILKLYL